MRCLIVGFFCMLSIGAFAQQTQQHEVPTKQYVKDLVSNAIDGVATEQYVNETVEGKATTVYVDEAVKDKAASDDIRFDSVMLGEPTEDMRQAYKDKGRVLIWIEE